MTGGYRPLLFSYTACVRSLAVVHNETANIVTHGLGAVLWAVLFVLVSARLEDYGVVETAERLCFQAYMLAALACHCASTCFHTFNCHSHDVHVTCLNADLSGITALIALSYFPPIYAAFSCWPTWRLVYLSAVGLLALALVVLPNAWPPFVRDPRFRMLRVVLYSGLALFGVLPSVHVNMLRGFWAVWPLTKRIVTMYLIYACGVVVYLTRFPESIKHTVRSRGWRVTIRETRFDVFGSHAIWHLIVTSGTLYHLSSCLAIAAARDDLPCPSP